MRIVRMTITRPRMVRDSAHQYIAFSCLAAVLLLAACGPTGATGPSGSATHTPIPTRADGMTRFSGKIVDGKSGAPVADVCVIIGPPVDCAENMPHSGEDGSWFADLPVAGGGLSWTFNFVKSGYETNVVKVVSEGPGEKRIDVTLQRK